MIVCRKCGFKFNRLNERNAHLHHLIPKCIGGTDKDGRSYLCGSMFGCDAHRRLHEAIYNEFGQKIKEFSEAWLQQNDN